MSFGIPEVGSIHVAILKDKQNVLHRILREDTETALALLGSQRVQVDDLVGAVEILHGLFAGHDRWRQHFEAHRVSTGLDALGVIADLLDGVRRSGHATDGIEPMFPLPTNLEAAEDLDGLRLELIGALDENEVPAAVAAARDVFERLSAWADSAQQTSAYVADRCRSIEGVVERIAEQDPSLVYSIDWSVVSGDLNRLRGWRMSRTLQIPPIPETLATSDDALRKIADELLKQVSPGPALVQYFLGQLDDLTARDEQSLLRIAQLVADFTELTHRSPKVVGLLQHAGTVAASTRGSSELGSLIRSITLTDFFEGGLVWDVDTLTRPHRPRRLAQLRGFLDATREGLVEGSEQATRAAGTYWLAKLSGDYVDRAEAVCEALADEIDTFVTDLFDRREVAQGFADFLVETSSEALQGVLVRAEIGHEVRELLRAQNMLDNAPHLRDAIFMTDLVVGRMRSSIDPDSGLVDNDGYASKTDVTNDAHSDGTATGDQSDRSEIATDANQGSLVAGITTIGLAVNRRAVDLTGTTDCSETASLLGREVFGALGYSAQIVRLEVNYLSPEAWHKAVNSSTDFDGVGVSHNLEDSGRSGRDALLVDGHLVDLAANQGSSHDAGFRFPAVVVIGAERAPVQPGELAASALPDGSGVIYRFVRGLDDSRGSRVILDADELQRIVEPLRRYSRTGEIESQSTAAAASGLIPGARTTEGQKVNEGRPSSLTHSLTAYEDLLNLAASRALGNVFEAMSRAVTGSDHHSALGLFARKASARSKAVAQRALSGVTQAEREPVDVRTDLRLLRRLTLETVRVLDEFPEIAGKVRQEDVADPAGWNAAMSLFPSVQRALDSETPDVAEADHSTRFLVSDGLGPVTSVQVEQVASNVRHATEAVDFVVRADRRAATEVLDCLSESVQRALGATGASPERLVSPQRPLARVIERARNAMAGHPLATPDAAREANEGTVTFEGSLESEMKRLCTSSTIRGHNDDVQVIDQIVESCRAAQFAFHLGAYRLSDALARGSHGMAQTVHRAQFPPTVVGELAEDFRVIGGSHLLADRAFVEAVAAAHLERGWPSRLLPPDEHLLAHARRLASPNGSVPQSPLIPEPGGDVKGTSKTDGDVDPGAGGLGLDGPERSM